MSAAVEDGTVHVLEFWGGFRDGYRYRLKDEPPKSIVFRIVPASVEMMQPVNVSATIETDLVVYELIAIDDAGVYRYVERGTKTRMREKGWWFQ